jgi:hypothetical protein
VREYFQLGYYVRLLAIALVILVWALPANADTLRTRPVAAPDRLFDASLLPQGELPTLSTGLVAQPQDNRAGLVESLNISWVTRDDRSGTDEGGVRRFIVLAILLGAAIRYLTSPAFYRWAADVFNPLDWS